jgi:hypothetical protein
LIGARPDSEVELFFSSARRFFSFTGLRSFAGKVQAANVLGTADLVMCRGRTAVAFSQLQRKCRLSSPASTMLFPPSD